MGIDTYDVIQIHICLTCLNFNVLSDTNAFLSRVTDIGDTN